MNATTHPVAPEEVMALLDGELSTDRAQTVSAHIDQCAECQEIQAAMQATLHKIAAWKIDAPPRLLEHVFLKDGQIGTSQQGGVVSLSWLHDILSRKRIWAPALALVAVLFAVVGALTSRFAYTPDFAMKRAAQSQAVRTVTKLEPLDEKGTSAGRAAGDRLSEDAGKALRPESSKEFEHLQLYSRIERPVQRPESHQGLIQTGPMIARTVSVSIIVKDFDASRDSLDAILTRHNGYAAGLNVATPQGAARALQASLRIPDRQLATALSELKALGRVELENQNGEEVTQQHADLLARLKNSRETEQRLQDVLRTRTGKVKDVLEVEQEIERVRGEIEQMEAEQQTLEHRVDFATIDLKLAEEYKAQLTSPTPSVATQLRNASVNGFRSAFESLLALVLFLAESGPAILLWLALLFVPVRLLWRRYQRTLVMG
jgi:hypothetical protein